MSTVAVRNIVGGNFGSFSFTVFSSSVSSSSGICHLLRCAAAYYAVVMHAIHSSWLCTVALDKVSKSSFSSAFSSFSRSLGSIHMRYYILSSGIL